MVTTKLVDLFSRDSSLDILSRDLKVDLETASRETFLATLCPKEANKVILSRVSGHFSGHCVRVNDPPSPFSA